LIASEKSRVLTRKALAPLGSNNVIEMLKFRSLVKAQRIGDLPAQQSLIGLSEMTVWALIVGQTTCPQNAKRPRAWQGRL